MRRGRVRSLFVTMLAAALAGAALLPAAAGPAQAPSALAIAAVPSTTLAAAAASAADPADRVRTPKPDWFDCFPGDVPTECATVELPLDYDRPKGATTTVAVVRLHTANPARRIGSLFINPGGPGGSGVDIALAAPLFLSADVLERYDIVGVDPRGVHYSDNVRCFRNAGEQAAAYDGLLTVAFPYTDKEEAAAVRSARAIGRACSTTGRPLTGAMSTAEVARDMDVIRRAVGDRRLHYLGFSYGSYLGQVYANMFPQRVGRVAIDGVVDPVAWAGRRSTASTPQFDRLRSADGAWKALREILNRCDKAGPEACPIAPVARRTLNGVTAALKKKPLVIEVDGESITLTYATFVNVLLVELYAASGWQYVVADIAYVRDLQASSTTAADRAAARAGVRAALDRSAALDFPYDNSFETLAGVACTDGRNPASAARWPAVADAVEARAPLFGRAWMWLSAPCAENTWTVRDEDAYRGPFTARTASPVLVVGNYWDPATNYQSAVKVAGLLPNSRLLSSDSWGHTAYGTSACATDAVDRYLVSGALPARGTVCVGADQPFQPSSERRAGPDRRPPITPFVPGGVPTG